LSPTLSVERELKLFEDMMAFLSPLAGWGELTQPLSLAGLGRNA
jgi:hypothetical protein